MRPFSAYLSSPKLPSGLAILALTSLLLLSHGSQVQAQGDSQDIQVPRNSQWLSAVDLTKVPNIPVRPVGSGICEDSLCDGTDNDRCFESCGNVASPEDLYGCPSAHHWALTFDDGPSNYTSELLDILDEYRIKATFCVLGSNVKRYPQVLQRIFQSGHQIASHTYSHPHLMSLTNEEIIYEIKATEEAIRDAIGIKPKYIRPPFGEADDRVKGLLRTMGYRVLMWNVDPTDYDVYMLPDVSNKIQGAFRMAAVGQDTGLNANEDPGFISLQHDLYQQSIDQVPDIIQSLLSKGFIFTTAADCAGDAKPHEILGGEDGLEAQAVIVGKIAAVSANVTSVNATSASVSDTNLLTSATVSNVSNVSSGASINIYSQSSWVLGWVIATAALLLS
ncbi:hypothetical protein J3Q64DRAFT_1672714 [Phycomyces blakesleeanus]|uniref:NodB homology domain-containing protein n=2 Tax=Phycomyces blakesleeanus TaxID=4837 RepID=A0ABR3B9B4_PHYBL